MFFSVEHYEADGSGRRRTISSPRYHQNILKRLPVKSLIRFRRVCKNWKNLFNAPYFIADHLHHSSNQNTYLLLGGYCPFDPSYLCFLDHEMQVLEVQRAPLIGSLLGVTVIGSCNGLLCLQPNNRSIFLCNPPIREVREVCEAVNYIDVKFCNIGFGFSSIVNDYKLVRIRISVINDRVFHVEGFPSTINMVNEVQVYSLRTGSWKEIEFGNLDGVSVISHRFPANGALFWFGFMLNVGEKDENDGHLIISFDVATEVFTLIPLPTPNKSHRKKLTVHDNELAILCHTTIGNHESSLVDLWVMDEGTGTSGERWNWTKKSSTSPYPCLLLPWTTWRNEIACYFTSMRPTERDLNNRERKVVLFNITNNEFRMFATSGYGNGLGIFTYVESFVPVGNNYIEEL